MCKLCITLPTIFPDTVSLLRKGVEKTVTLTEKQCLALFCAGFLSIIPEPSDKVNGANFRKFYRGAALVDSQREKLIGILSSLEHLFRDGEEHPAHLETKIQAIRCAQPESSPVLDFWEDASEKMLPLEIVTPESEKDSRHFSARAKLLNLHAPKLGGDVIALGADYDERLVIEHPCLFAFMSLMETVQSNESLSIRGVRKVCQMEGSGKNLKFVTVVDDQCPIVQNFRQREIVGTYPPSYKEQPNQQFRSNQLLEDLNRMYSASTALPALGATAADNEPIEEEGEEEGQGVREGGEEDDDEVWTDDGSPVYAFPPGVDWREHSKGPAQLKLLQLWLATSKSGRILKLIFPHVGAEKDTLELFGCIEEVSNLLLDKGVTIGQLFNMVVEDRKHVVRHNWELLELLKSHLLYGV